MGKIRAEKLMMEAGAQSHALAEFAANLEFRDIPPDVVERATDILVDTVGCILGGAAVGRHRAGAAITGSLYKTLEVTAGRSDSTILGTRYRADVVSGAYTNAYLGELLDFADSLAAHPSVAAIPAGISIAEWIGASGPELIAAIVAGYEVGVRVGEAIAPTVRRGARIPSQWSWQGFVAAVTAGRLLRLSAPQILDAMGYVGSASPVAGDMYDQGRPLPWTKTVFPEQTRIGVLAALLAEHRFRGFRNTLESSIGFWTMVGSDRLRPARLVDGLGSRWLISESALKAYPACRMSHSAIEGALAAAEGLDLEVIERIEVSTAGIVVTGLSDPRPATVIDATFSLPYTVAVALYGIEPGVAWYSDEIFGSPEIYRLMDRITLRVDPAINARFLRERRYPASIAVHARGGRSRSAEVESATPLTGRSAIDEKYIRLATAGIGGLAEDTLADLRTITRATDTGTIFRQFALADEAPVSGRRGDWMT